VKQWERIFEMVKCFLCIFFVVEQRIVFDDVCQGNALTAILSRALEAMLKNRWPLDHVYIVAKFFLTVQL
jgi:hypothetical protein